jgi:methionine biosynthesis protein MetW
LQKDHGASVLGVEIDQDSIVRCIGNGGPVIQGELNDNLDYFPEHSFDLAVLSHTLQETRRPDLLLKQIVRIGKYAAVSVINFGHWRCRLQVAFSGKMPRSSQMPFQWYDTPNIHFCTLQDFRALCSSLGIRIVKEYPIAAKFPKLTGMYPNLFAVSCVFVLEEK